MRSTPGCWERYCSLWDWESAIPGEGAIGTVQDLVDSYAAQHATNPDRRNCQSVAVHLMSLCGGLERGLTGRERRARIGLWVRHEYPMLMPRPTAYAITVSDVTAAPETKRPSVIQRMAISTWSAWSVHQDVVRSWLDR